MPAQKRSFPDSPHDHHRHTKHHLQEKTEEEEDAQQQEQDNYESNGSDSHRALSSPSEDNSEFVFVELLEIRKEVQCPICLGIIKKTRTVMECLHRFCRECIDKSMRMGNNECPACRTHCASRRSLRDDPNYDALIAALYPDIEKYEEEELEFREEDKNRNKLIQASIAKVVQRQSEALVKRRRDTPGSFVTRSQRIQRNVLSRRQNQVMDNLGSEDNEDENDNNEKDSSSTDERCTEIRQRRRKRRTRVRPSQPSSSTASPDRGCIESDVDIRENRGISSRPLSKPQKLTWGRGGFRSHTRHGSGSGNGMNSKSARSSRLAKFVDHLRNLNENTDELDVHLILFSLDKQSTPSLLQPHLCCRPTLSVKHLCEYVAGQTSLPIEEVEILAVKGCSSTVCEKSFDEISSFDEQTALIIDPSKVELETLQGHESLTELKSKCISQRAHMILAYRRKE
ncbi:putative E3 ubiquitin-protein ligase RING1a isoform X2 [Vigna radiata var. radiata]|uniref:E3 ubiquitin-protein ligase RING1a isoform X2 n=1 Tax=Vigna radiata var. radiata TaxID=3916 RepID=A0A1S3TGW7_VIGRR|nr:putative E3 ubiquitin-protein ligase RING1a isoform X2 [Vigna radiata var. radiata]